MTVSCVVGTVLMFLEFGVLACSAQGSRRRSRFYIRLGCTTLVMLALAVGLAFAMRFSPPPQRAFGLVWVALLLAALAAAPALELTTRSHRSRARPVAAVAADPVPVRHHLRRVHLAAALRWRILTRRGSAGAITTGRACATSAGGGRPSSRCGVAHRPAQVAGSRFR